ncbi:Granzyme B(G,H) [Labeo rohita]|uniref:Granzyme B(G,H) n=1 Tax=Labeo rohita TaxID=84645 RepID=A0ABQ8L2G3_LABRO|nr:Granzyme B(G,H) [Labeo rohita]
MARSVSPPSLYYIFTNYCQQELIDSLIVFIMVKFSLLLLASLLPHTTCIVISMEAKPHSRPYMVSVQSKEQHICIRIKVESYHPHPQYTFIRESFDNDILLLRLEKNAQLNNNIKPISIPAEEADIKADSVCSIAGWGRLETNGNQSNHFMETNVKVMNNNTCESKWGGGRLFSFTDDECIWISRKLSCMGIQEALWFVETLQLVLLPLVTLKSNFVHFIMVIFSLLLLASLLPHLTCIALVNVNIVNDKEAKPHSRPYMVSVQSKEQHICSGFLISDRFVMTAAHCRNKSQGSKQSKVSHCCSARPTQCDYWITLGKRTLEGKGMLRRSHPVRREKNNAQLNDNMKPISIPVEEGDIEADSVCSIAGWGLLETNGKQSNHLMETNVTIMNSKECESKWGEGDFSASLMMCVYRDGGSCDGDTGGPLVCGDAAVGVTSFGDPEICNSPERPEVYTKISVYLPWIINIIFESSHKNEIYLLSNLAMRCNSSQELIASLIVFMMAIISLLLLASLLPHLTFTARANVGIVNGKEAKPHSRPYMVSVQVKEQHICVLTVVLGAHNLRNKKENSVRIKVDSYYQHPKYTNESFHNDILLLKLEKNAQLNNNIKSISIPTKEGDIEADSVCSIAGWGLLETKGKQSNHLMETNVTVMNNKECESKWGGGRVFSFTDDGDSGGPLVCGDTAVGVTSFGDPKICNSPELPEVYTKISAYLPWIKSITGNGSSAILADEMNLTSEGQVWQKRGQQEQRDDGHHEDNQ